jgi:hypothetical protein
LADSGGNDIGKEGVRYLVEIDMKNLQTLNMCKGWLYSGGNGIEAEGALLLLNGNWKRLSCINLCNPPPTQITTSWTMRASAT